MSSPTAPLARFAGRVVIVTGATGGLGRACAIRLAEEGATVVVTGRRPEATTAVADELRERGAQALAITVDVTDPVAVQHMVDTTMERYGRIDGAVNNAGHSPPGQPVTGFPDDLWHETMDVNVNAMFRCLRAELEYMVPAGRGSIVNIASYTAGTVLSKGVVAYAAAKHAVLGMTRAAARDCAEFGVRVNAVGPGHIRTQMIERLLTPDGGEERLNARIPLGRVSEPAEIAGVVAFMLSDDASFVTGQMLVADGGLSI